MVQNSNGTKRYLFISSPKQKCLQITGSPLITSLQVSFIVDLVIPSTLLSAPPSCHRSPPLAMKEQRQEAEKEGAIIFLTLSPFITYPEMLFQAGVK